MAKTRRDQPKRRWIPLLVVVLLIVAGGAGYYYWRQQTATTNANQAPTLNTSTVRRGSITLSASGSGTLLPGQTAQLSFATTGTVGKVNVQVGQVVKQGQVLAALANPDSLQAAVNAAQQDLISAQQALDTLRASGAATIANAQLALSDAQKAVTTAQSGVVQKGWQRCDQATTDAYYYEYMHAQDQLTALGDGGGNQDYYLKEIVPAKNLVAKDYAAYQYCAGYTSYEIDASHAKLAVAQAQLKQAQDNLTLLQQNSGINPTDLAAAQNKVDNAQVALDTAKANLDGATLKAPFDGTILTVAGQAGDTSGTGAFLTLADLAHPQVQFSVDETDLDKVALGEDAVVTFDALPNQTFSGKVVQVNPALVSSSNINVVQGLIQLDLSKAAAGSITLPQGLTASIELVRAKADNVLTVPAQAVRDLGDGTYGVFVVPAGSTQPKLEIVQIGLKDAASVEIKQGLKQGDVVSTGTAQTR